MLPKTTLVLGGAASGKSVYAESLVERCGARSVYLATAQAYDDEMRAKIRTHQARRSGDWATIEAPLEVAEALRNREAGEICLLDCATMWLSNILLRERDLEPEQAALLDALRACPARVVVISNEVGQGIVPDNALARRFREAQGRLNIALAAEASLVVQVVAGLPRALKGVLP